MKTIPEGFEKLRHPHRADLPPIIPRIAALPVVMIQRPKLYVRKINQEFVAYFKACYGDKPALAYNLFDEAKHAFFAGAYAMFVQCISRDRHRTTESRLERSKLESEMESEIKKSMVKLRTPN